MSTASREVDRAALGVDGPGAAGAGAAGAGVDGPGVDGPGAAGAGAAGAGVDGAGAAGAGVARTPVPVHPEAVDGDPATLRWVVPAGLLGMVGPVGRAPQPLEELRGSGLLRAIVAEPAALRLTLAAGLSWRAEGARVRAALQEALAVALDDSAAFRPDFGDSAGVPDGASFGPPVGPPKVPGAGPNSSPNYAGAPFAAASADPAAQNTAATPTVAASADPAAQNTAATPTVAASADPAAQNTAATPTVAASADPAVRLRAAVEQVLAGDVGQYIASHGGQARIVEVTAEDVVLDLGGTCAACPARGFTLNTRIDAAVRALHPGLGEVRLVEAPRRPPILRIGRRPATPPQP